MELDELLRHELLALIEIRLTGRTVNCTAMHQLLDNGMIIDLHGDQPYRHAFLASRPGLKERATNRFF